ncbi:hypothetical protein INR49_029622 [Caranx melampygus]|nr:hypothetical protein INR49_029622 [Caranx melampygus]
MEIAVASTDCVKIDLNGPPPSDPGPKAGVQSGQGTGDRLASHDTPQHAATQGEQGQGHVARKSLQVQEWLCLNCQMQRALGMDMTTPRSKSQQQIHSPSNAAKPELKPDTSSQPAPQTQPPPQTQPLAQAQPAAGPPKQTGPAGPGQPQAKLPPGAVPLPGIAKAPSQPDLSRSSPAHQPQHPRQDQTRSAGSSPSRQPPPPEQTFGKLFGFGASLLNQASTLISETTQPQQQPPKPTPKPGGPPGPGPGAGKPSGPPPAQQGPRAPTQQQQQRQQQQQQQQQLPPDSSKPKACCPLCKTNLNIGNTEEQPNYNTCTQCHSQVCNMCGFNPTPHLAEAELWASVPMNKGVVVAEIISSSWHKPRVSLRSPIQSQMAAGIVHPSLPCSSLAAPKFYLQMPFLSYLVSECTLRPTRDLSIGLITSSELIIFKAWWLC